MRFFFPVCSPKTSTVILPLESPPAFSYSGEAELPVKWWTAFKDEELNKLFDYALDSNFDLLGAWQRVQVVEAVADRESSFLLRDVEASLQGGTSHPQPGADRRKPAGDG